jgi:hypothetical protein
MEQTSFLESGGDPDWLRGIGFAPVKLQALFECNALLAHRPWLLTAKHIAHLTSGLGDGDCYSIAEVVQAFVIMTTFHSLAGFVYGMGVAPECDLADMVAEPDSKTNFRQDSKADPHDDKDKSDAQLLYQKLRQSEFSIDSRSTSDPYRSGKSDNFFDEPSNSICTISTCPSEAHEQFQQLARGGVYEPLFPMRGRHRHRFIPTHAELHTLEVQGELKEDALAFLSYDSSYDQTFYLHDYSWGDHGFPLIDRFYQGAGSHLDAEFNVIYNLTYNSYLEHTDVDTSPLRQGIWYFVLKMFGMVHADFNYSKCGMLTDHIALESFVKKIAAKPETLDKRDFDNLTRLALDCSERCHIALLAFEARRQASLLYGLHAIMTHMSR